MLSKSMNGKLDSCGNYVLCKTTYSNTDQNAPLSKHDVCGIQRIEDTSPGTAVVLGEDKFAPHKTELSSPLNKQISSVKNEELIVHGVLDTSKYIPASSKREHNTDKKRMNIEENSLKKCQYCHTTFPYSLFKLHAQTCNKSIANESSNNSEENLATCRFCKSIFPDSLIQQHTETCTQRKMHKCEICQKCFRVQSKLLIHQHVHSSERPYPCKICSKSFKFRSGLSRHMRREHSSGGKTEHEQQSTPLEKEISFRPDSFEDCIEEDSQCQCCESSSKGEHFMRQTAFEAAKTKMEQETRPFKQENVDLKNCCQTVGQTMVTESDNYRDNSIRRWPETFEIVENPKSNFEVTQELAQVPNGHLPSAKHSPYRQRSGKSKVYECEYCSSVFEKPSKLLVHKLIHSEERLFACEICQNTFKHKGSLTRHIKEQHYSQGRRASSVAVDGKQRSIQKHRGPLEKESNFENESNEYTAVQVNYSSDEEQDCVSMVLDRKQECQMSLSFRDESSFQNVDDSIVQASPVKENRTLRYGRGKALEKEQNNPSMIFSKTQGDRNGLSLHDEVSLRNLGKTDEFGVNKNKIGLLQVEDCSDRNGLSSQNEFNTESRDNTNDDDPDRESVNKKCKEGDYEIHENMKRKQTKHDLQCRDINLENMGNGVEVNAKRDEIPEEPKLYYCPVCPRIFPRSSALRKHKIIHNDSMSFSCNICGHYFKYKGSLTRHVKEQHYGKGRKSFGIVVDGQEESILEHSSPPEKVSFEDAVNSSAMGNGGSTRSPQKQDYGQVNMEDCMTADDEAHEGKYIQNGDRHSKNRSENCKNKEDSESCESLDDKEQNDQSGKFEEQQKDEKILCLMDKVCFENFGSSKECLVRQSDASYEENNVGNPSLGGRPNDQIMMSDSKQRDQMKVVCFGDVDTEVCLVKEDESCKHVKCNKHILSVDDGQGKEASLTNIENRSETFQYEEDYFAENNLEKVKKVYECPECPQAFPIPSALRKHKVIHSDNMPFSCKICGRYFKYKGSLRRHIKEQHYGLGRKSLSSVFGDMGGYKQINCPPLEENKNSLDINESLKCKDGSTEDLNDQDLKQGKNDANSMVVDEKNEGKPDQEDCSSVEKSSFDMMREHENCDYKVGTIQENAETSDARQNDQSMIGNEMSLPDELGKDGLQNADSAEEDTDIPSMIYRERQEDEDRVIIRDGDNEEEVETWNHQVPVHFPHLEDNFESGERNLEVKRKMSEICEENFDVDNRNFNVNSASFETPDKCYFPAIPSDLMQKYEGIKIYECPECQKAFAKSSHLRKHSQSHSDVMSFSCQICERRFKYKDSLSRHIKEQHYGQGRKGLRMVMAEKLGREEENKNLNFLETKDDLENKCNSLEIADEESTVKGTFEAIVDDERPRKFGVNSYIQNHNEQAIQEKDNVGRDRDENISFEQNGKERNWNNIKQDKPKIGSDNLEKAPVDFSCTLCGRYCKYRSSLSRHYREQHLGKGRKADKCSFEDGNTKQEYSDRGERKLKENGSEINSNSEQVFQKDNVAVTHDEKFKSSHFELLKTKKVHKCSDCPKTFWSSSELKEHTYKHTDIRSFVCTLCEKAFKFRSGLVRHNRKEHKKNGLTSLTKFVNENVDGNHISPGNNLRNGCLTSEQRSPMFEEGSTEFGDKIEEDFSNGGGGKLVHSIVDEIDESHSSPENVNSVVEVADKTTNAVVSARSICQKQCGQKKPASYNCNKCDAVFKQLCDFLTHQRIHK
ncbi:uncharacterized protein LOC114518265 [Dendronephthya gigantea]|uniref:uncharacterized protein LOC114518265 n=1 Tax=Dendronephthya gigantea TaxID=151771 RepID=UPI00106C7174|nr:uncharacterized protein LOC114518265 [Dendronephthya gigantea]